MEERVRKAEQEIAGLKASLDWAKLVATILVGVVLAGFSLITALSLNLGAKVDGISSKLADEFKAQRLEQNAQVSVIANAITATKNQAPQVILVPAPATPADKSKP